MKLNQELKSGLLTLNDLDKQKIKEIKQTFDDFSKKSEVSLEGLKLLFNLQSVLHTLTEQYSNRLLSLLKQRHMLD
tara:strand:- start:4445 stop:4672 length:228 start_codon:yes stop_codon:yes gene_type:complete